MGKQLLNTVVHAVSEHIMQVLRHIRVEEMASWVKSLLREHEGLSLGASIPVKARHSSTPLSPQCCQLRAHGKADPKGYIDSQGAEACTLGSGRNPASNAKVEDGRVRHRILISGLHVSLHG